MALHDIETMAMLKDELEAINPNILIYGEGWTGGGSPLPDEEKALKKNVSQLNDIAVFSDDLRDAIKGHVFTKTDKGFVNGGQGMEESLKFGIVASTLHGQVNYPSVKWSKFAYATSPTQIVSYVEAHDNLTLWDKLVITNPDASVEQLIAMHRMANAIVLTSQGIPFIHAGADFLRTKGGNENSYNAPDSVNRLDWSRKDEYQSNVDYFAGLIALRKAHPAFRMTTAADVKANLSFIETDLPNVVAYTLNNNANGDDWDTIAVLINANETEVQVTLEESGWVVVVNGDQAGTTKLADIGSKTITVPAQTLMVLVDSDAYYGFNWGLVYLIGTVLLIGGGLAYYFLVYKKKAA
jgi:pullulanase